MLLKIKELRKAKKISQIDLAAQIDVSVRMFAEYENETTDIPLRKLQKVAEFLNLPISSLINDKSYSDGEIANNLSIASEPVPLYNTKDELIEMQREVIVMQREKLAELERKIGKGKEAGKTGS